ncbi:MAG TPA: VWA domain-containing protein [Pyrinomonadaceae bacterium]|nr:VWA domain-containing protein [Pyrinomonadaceae bacterium]
MNGSSGKTGQKTRAWPLPGLVSMLIAGAMISLGAGAGGQEPSSKQQRPRRVAGSENTSSGAQNPAGTPAAGEEVGEGDVVRVDTQLVSVPAIVSNSLGRPVGGLRPDNFIIYEDGQKQTIANFGTTQAPFEIALLLDTSGSTRADVELIRQSANAFITALRSGDRVAIVAFKDQAGGGSSMATVDVLAKLTEDRKVLRAAIQNLGSSNGTPFYDALARIADEIFREPPREEVRGRRAVVALTDGVDSTSNSDYDEARNKLLRAGVACYFIEVNTEDFVEDRLLKDCQDDGQLTLSARQLQRYRRIFVPQSRSEDYIDFCQMGQFQRMQISRDLYNLARREMNDLARAAGARNFVAATLQDARAAFARVADDIGTQYSLGYYPTNKARDGKFRSIKVEVRGLNGKNEVRAREGYKAPNK